MHLLNYILTTNYNRATMISEKVDYTCGLGLFHPCLIYIAICKYPNISWPILLSSFIAIIILDLFMYSLQSLRHRLSLIADSTSIGCRVGWVELHSKIYERKWPSTSAYHRTNLFRLHSFSLRGCVFNSSKFFDSDCEVARFLPITISCPT